MTVYMNHMMTRLGQKCRIFLHGHFMCPFDTYKLLYHFSVQCSPRLNASFDHFITFFYQF